MSTPVYERETVEFQPAQVTLNGVPVTSGVQFAVVPLGNRPALTDWHAAAVDGALIGVMVAGYAPGDYEVFGQVPAAQPGPPVVKCGAFHVS